MAEASAKRSTRTSKLLKSEQAALKKKLAAREETRQALSSVLQQRNEKPHNNKSTRNNNTLQKEEYTQKADRNEQESGVNKKKKQEKQQNISAKAPPATNGHSKNGCTPERQLRKVGQKRTVQYNAKEAPPKKSKPSKGTVAPASDNEKDSSSEDVSSLEDGEALLRYLGGDDSYFNEDSESEDYTEDEYDEEEEDERYSDFDEDDYEEEDESDCSNNISSDDFSSGSNDTTYELPDDVPEDVRVHQGTATMHDLLSTDNVCFDSDNDEVQTVELPTSGAYEVTQQPACYSKENLVQLNEAFRAPAQVSHSSSASDCPDLVPIVGSDCLAFDDSECDSDDSGEDETLSLGSCYEVCSSLSSVDINDKYLGQESSDSEGEWPVMEAHVVSDLSSVSKDLDIDMTPVSDNEMDVAMTFPRTDDSTKALIISAAVIEHDEEEEEEEQQTESVETAVSNDPQVAATANTQLLQSRFYNAVDTNKVLVWLQDAFYLYGTVRLVLIAGGVQIYGYSAPSNQELEIFSPRGCAAVQVAPESSDPNCGLQLQKVLESLGNRFEREALQDIAAGFDVRAHALLLLRRNTERQNCVTFMRKYMNENVFPNMLVLSADRPLYATEELLHCVINADSEKALRVPAVWENLPFTETTRMLIAGGKGVGKSTLLRHLLNRHLALESAGVLLIDLDIGQPELFVPQTISCSVVKKPLLGPGFLLNCQPDKAYVVGHCNALLCAHAYARAVQQLIDFCRDQASYTQLPWLVNTMGYNKGCGLEFMKLIVTLLRPTDVVQLQSDRDINNYDALLQPERLAAVPRTIFNGEEFANKISTEEEVMLQYNLHVLPSAVSQQSRFGREWDMSPKDLRYAIVLARLSDAMQKDANWLSECRPLRASLNHLKLVYMCDVEQARDELIQAIEANLVYLCCSREQDDAPLECIGIGIVRAIDHNAQDVFLLPAMPYCRMGNVNCLALGETTLPTSLFTNQGPLVRNVAHFVYNTVDASASKAIKQIYRRPAEFLSGRHKTL